MRLRLKRDITKADVVGICNDLEAAFSPLAYSFEPLANRIYGGIACTKWPTTSYNSLVALRLAASSDQDRDNKLKIATISSTSSNSNANFKMNPLHFKNICFPIYNYDFHNQEELAQTQDQTQAQAQAQAQSQVQTEVKVETQAQVEVETIDFSKHNYVPRWPKNNISVTWKEDWADLWGDVVFEKLGDHGEFWFDATPHFEAPWSTREKIVVASVLLKRGLVEKRK